MKENRFLQSKVLFKQKLALILFGLFLFFVLLEINLRLGGFILLSVQEYKNSQSIKQKSAYRILCLGESTTQGQYPQFLEEILNQRNIGVNFSVIDKGRRGTVTSAILIQVESYLAEYHPNMVVAMMGINDEGGHIPLETIDISKGGSFLKSFRTYKLIRLLWLHILTKAKEVGLYKTNVERRSPSGSTRKQLENVPIKPALIIDAYNKAIELNPADDKIYVELGWLYRERGEFSRAEDAYKKAIKLNPNNDNAYFRLGWVYLDQSKIPQAEDACKKALEINPKNDNAYFILGWVYQDQNKSAKAEDAYNKAIELNPADDKIYVELGWLYRERGEFSRAEDAYKKAIKLNPNNDNAYFKLGCIYKEQDRLSQAEVLLKKALEINPNNDNAYRAILILLEETGKSELVKEYAERINNSELRFYNLITVDNYRKLKEILDKKGIKLVCVQYPMRNAGSLKKIFRNDEGVIFVDNEIIFKKAVKETGYKDYFMDVFGGDFGHCTQKGNWLLAQNIANVILKEVFNK